MKFDVSFDDKKICCHYTLESSETTCTQLFKITLSEGITGYVELIKEGDFEPLALSTDLDNPALIEAVKTALQAQLHRL